MSQHCIQHSSVTMMFVNLEKIERSVHFFFTAFPKPSIPTPVHLFRSMPSAAGPLFPRSSGFVRPDLGGPCRLRVAMRTRRGSHRCADQGGGRRGLRELARAGTPLRLEHSHCRLVARTSDVLQRALNSANLIHICSRVVCCCYLWDQCHVVRDWQVSSPEIGPISFHSTDTSDTEVISPVPHMGPVSFAGSMDTSDTEAFSPTTNIVFHQRGNADDAGTSWSQPGQPSGGDGWEPAQFEQLDSSNLPQHRFAPLSIFLDRFVPATTVSVRSVSCL